MINRWLGMVLGFCGTIILGKATLFLWMERQVFDNNPPLDRATFELHLKPPKPNASDILKVDALKQDYGEMARHYGPVLTTSIVIGALGCIASATWFLVSLRRRPRNQTLRTPVEQLDGISRNRWGSRLSLRQRSVLQCVSLAIALAFSGVALYVCAGKVREAKAKAAAQMLPVELGFYMKSPDPSSSEAAMVRRLQDDYFRMRLHWPLLGVLHSVLLMVCWLAVIGSLGGFLSWLWPRKPQPQPQIENTSAA